jgi:hypothetical protein
MKDNSNDRFDLNKLRLDPAKFATPYVPAKIRKRREQFVQVPMWWIEKLGESPLATGLTHQIACYICHLDWKSHGKPFKLPNGMLKYDGISRQSKWRALKDLERRKLIVVERRQRRSPVVHMMLPPNKMFHP